MTSFIQFKDIQAVFFSDVHFFFLYHKNLFIVQLNIFNIYVYVKKMDLAHTECMI